ncbi:hypothetical protein SBADM41S_08806 [Streptomyces badius]
MGVVILLVMAAGVAAMLTRKLPTGFALVLLAVAIAFLAGAPLTGENSVLDTVLQEGAPALAATMVAILLGSWLGRLLDETGIAGTLVRKIVEFGGDRPVVVALGVLGVSTLVGTVTGSAPAAMLAGIIGIPAMIAVGIPKVTAAGNDPHGHRRGHALRAADLAVLLHGAGTADPDGARLHAEAVPVRAVRRRAVRPRRDPAPRCGACLVAQVGLPEARFASRAVG